MLAKIISKFNHKLIFLILLPTVSLATNQGLVRSQITPDSSLGQERSLVTTNNKTSEIRGGARRGNNLFHSFKEFSIREGNSAYFIPQGNIANIFTRVTGSKISQIQGILGVKGQANLFFLNPNGIIFGKNAKLDLKGSFLATTGESFIFPNGSVYGAQDADAPPLLIINASGPVGIKFGNQPAQIINQGGLSVDSGQNLALIGGKVEITQGSLSTFGGNISLGSVASNNTITLNSEVFGVSYEGVKAFGDINVSGGATVYANRGGNISIQGNNINITQGARVYSSNAGNKPGGQVEIKGREGIAIAGFESAIYTQTVGTALGGNLTLEAKNLTISSAGKIYTLTKSSGTAGNLLVNTSESVEVKGVGFDELGNSDVSQLGSVVFPGVTGNGGNLTLNTGKLIVSEGGNIATATAGTGNAGNVAIKAKDSVVVTGLGFDSEGEANVSGILTGVLLPFALGNGGDLSIETGELLVSDGGIIATATLGIGKAGDLQIKAKTQVTISGVAMDFLGSGNPAGLIAGVRENAIGNGGNLSIETGKLLVADGGVISTATLGAGNGGNMFIKATDSLELKGIGFDLQGNVAFTQLVAGVGENAQGNGGNLTIETPKVLVREGAVITTATSGFGDAGNMFIKATDSIEVKGSLDNFGSIRPSGIVAGVLTDVTGNAGNFTIETAKLMVSEGGFISTGTAGSGNGGNLKITATDYIQVRGELSDNQGQGNASGINSGVISPLAKGNAGNLNLITEKLLVDDGGRVGASTIGSGNAGNVTITAKELIRVKGGAENSSQVFLSLINAGVSSTEATGNAGNLNLNTGKLLVFDGGEVSTATLGPGNAGSLSITASDSVEVKGGLDSKGNNISSNVGAGVVFSQGRAGSVTINTPQLSVFDNGIITVANIGTGIAGTISINSQSISLDNQGKILASSLTGNGGNVRLQVSNLILLRNESTISTETGVGVGGNINIDTQFIVAFPSENSDIIGNAFAGSGGVVTISARNIFGIQPTQNFIALPISDIRSSSQVVINNLEINPNVSPVETIPPLVNLAFPRLCENRQEGQTTEFYTIGRGGSVPGPENLFEVDLGVNPWLEFTEEKANTSFSRLNMANVAVFFPCQ